MSTRANIELWDRWTYEDEPQERLGVRLYHHYDGYPSWMGPELVRMLGQVKDTLDAENRSYWWDSERVGALFVSLSADGGMPEFQPCYDLYGDIEFLWKIYLYGQGEYEIKCKAVKGFGNNQRFVGIDWEAVIAREDDD